MTDLGDEPKPVFSIRRYSLWECEIHRTAPRAIAAVIPGLDPPAVVSTTQGDPHRRDGTGGTATNCRRLIPLAVHCYQQIIGIDLTYPQIVPSGIIHVVPCIGGS